MLQHFQLVCVPLVSSQNAHDTALSDSHLNRETSGQFYRTPGHRCDHLCRHTFPCCRIWSSGSACIGDGTCSFEFHDKFCFDVFCYLRSARCIKSKRYMTDGTTPRQQNDVYPSSLR
ncbi:hypothetical protein AVEN_178103-1 [Araneus ventricosus]|uniref:Uncharacterized protein n=1 Tax=Araneus ventricosus TaxID=182803 RepID=A0A4Y2T652_ARAVE|nr:hypothetical protein AVEN_223085-1 [Araneus ventricosus]GBN96099.1 hypothetical protein AVEN_178103-1 [Araneus ventricosus]